MNPLLAAALPGFAGNNNLWDDESLVNSIWNGIFVSFFPTTGTAGTFLVAPEMIKGTMNESYIADLAVMQISGTTPRTFKKPAICFEGKSSSSPDSWDSVMTQITNWTSKAHIGTYGKIWGIAAKGSQFTIFALDRVRSNTWYYVNINGAHPTFTHNGNNAVVYNITNPGNIALLNTFLTAVALNPFPVIPMPFGETENPLKVPHAAPYANSDPYLKKLFALASLHAALGSSREVFNADIIARGIKDDTPTKRLTQDQFDLINNANTSVQLEGTQPEISDQDIFDQTAMLATMVNTRIASINNEKNPNGYDITDAESQLRMINDAANGLFNAYNNQMSSFIVTKTYWTQQQSHTYDTASIQIDALKDLFASLALPESALNTLLGAANAFISNMKKISLSASNKGLKNAQLINFFAVQAPVGNPDLAHVAIQRMIYVQFNEATSEWSTACASYATYTLNVTIFGLDVQMNREVVSIMYDKAKELIIKDAETTLDQLGNSGGGDVNTVNTGTAQPIGPPPVNPSSLHIC